MKVTSSGMAKGGEGVAHDDSGRVVFVAGLLPGEQARVEVTDQRKRYSRARLVEVLDPSPRRVAPPCPFVGDGCGGCDFQHTAPEHQLELKREIVSDALGRSGLRGDVPDIDTVALPETDYRTSLRLRIGPDGVGFHRRGSHEVVPIDQCLVAHPLIDDLLAHTTFGRSEEVTLRVGARTGDRLVIASPVRTGVRAPDDVMVVGADELEAGKRAWIHEEVAGRTWRISANSFFQARPDGADALVELVRHHVDGIDSDARMVDAYSGVGLFAGAVGAGRSVVAIERSRSSVADARRNLADDDVRIVSSSVDRWRPSRAGVVVADPPRAGLGKVAAQRLAATNAERLVLINCDPASLGRDAALLTKRGYGLTTVTMVDLFPHTSHIETVASFDRVAT